tara:strand:+ start:16788 stop:16904 length:117 start_codon:yes stop_codon:yes gene_type:complete
MFAITESCAFDAVILQDHKRLPARFFGAFSGARLSRHS